MEFRVAIIFLFIGCTYGAHVSRRDPYWIGEGGGNTIWIDGSGFAEDQFNHFDPSIGNTFYLVNDGATIDCQVIRYLSRTDKIVANCGKRTNFKASSKYTIKVFVDGIEASGTQEVRFGNWVSPKIQTITPRSALPGALLEYYGYPQTTTYKGIDVENAVDYEEQAAVLTKVYMGRVECEVINATTGEFYAPMTANTVTCLSQTKNVGPMNGTWYVTTRGASVNDRYMMHIDSKDVLHQHHVYAGIENVSPSSGSSGGMTLITVTGVGFNEFPGSTQVLVGGAECDIQEITDSIITCLTPPESATSPGPRERGLTLELWDGQVVNIENEEEWAALLETTPTSTQYSVDATFDFEVSSTSAGRVTGYLNPPHTGVYALGIHSPNAWTAIYVATNGNPDNRTKVNHWEDFEMTEGIPTYFEVRYRGEESPTMLKMLMKDYTAQFSHAQSYMAANEEHRLQLNPREVFEVQRITPVDEDTPTNIKLYLNGQTSEVVDITDTEQVREAVLGLVSTKCEYIASDPDYMEFSDFEPDQELPTGERGTNNHDIDAYCGRTTLRLSSDTTIYRQDDKDLMVDVLEYPYVCFAIRGEVKDYMKIRYYWKDTNRADRHDTLTIDTSAIITADINTWSYQCIDAKAEVDASWINNQRNPGATLRYERIYLPGRIKDNDKIYVDVFALSSENIDVQQTLPSAVQSQGILIEDVEVSYFTDDNDVTSIDIEFQTANCFGEFPLLGLTDATGEASWITDLNNEATSHSFTVTAGDFTVTRTIVATNAVGGTWGITILGQTISGLSPTIEDHELQYEINSALGSTDIVVSRSGNCQNMRWDVQWTENPGRKELTILDDSTLTFDGTEVTLTPSRKTEGKIWHDVIAGDFLSVHRDEPSVSVNVRGYSAVCLGDCSFSYDDSNNHVLSSVAGSMEPSTGVHTVTITGTGFSSSDLSDYCVTVGSADCSVTAVTTPTTITCTVPHLPAGSHTVNVVMQPAGAASQPSIPVTYSVTLSLTSVTPTTGGTGGGYDIQIYGSGFPNNVAGWTGSTVTVGGVNCDITDADSASVTCCVPAGSAGAVDIVATVSGVTATLVGGFTYDSSLSGSIISGTRSSSSYSVSGGETYTITGTGLGDGSQNSFVKVGNKMCETITWEDTMITCTLPSQNPGTYDVVVRTHQGFASGSLTVSYVLKVTGTSASKGSVYGGTTIVLDGEGFGTDCTVLEVTVGDCMVCDITECTDTQITCVTRLVAVNHIVSNTGTHGSYGAGFAWDPVNVKIVEGDTITWQWTKIHPLSQVLLNVFQTKSTTNFDYDGTGFNSGSPISEGALSVTFPNTGTYSFAGDPVIGNHVMAGKVEVQRPSEDAKKIEVTLGGIKADYEPSGSNPPVSDNECSPLLETPLDSCTSTAPSAPDSDNPYLILDECFTPVVNSIAASATENIAGLQGIQVRAGVTLTITGSGFGAETCQTLVSVGPASCTVSASSDTSITCTLDDLANIISLKAFPVVVRVKNRGIACVDINNYEAQGQITVVPVVTSYGPTSGSTAGGTTVIFRGSGLKSFDELATVTGPCEVSGLDSECIMCVTPENDDETVTFSVFVSAYNIPVLTALTLTYSFSTAETPSIASVSTSGETFTITGTNFGTDMTSVTVTLNSISGRHGRNIETDSDENLVGTNMNSMKENAYSSSNDIQENRINEKIMKDQREDSDNYFEEVEDEDEEYPSYLPKIDSNLFDDFEAITDFWGKFTNTNAKTFEESKRLGAWRIPGTKPKQEVEKTPSVERQVENLREDPSSYNCVVSALSDTSIVCATSGIVAGTYDLDVSINGVGNALPSSSISISPTISSISPEEGSTNGGALLVISGAGFTPGSISITVGGVPCPLEAETPSSLSCRIPSNAEGTETVEVTSSGVSTTSPTDFTYSSTKTPVLTAVSPNTDVTPGSSLILTGTYLMPSGSNPVVMVGDSDCAIVSASATSVTCTAPDVAGGSQSVTLSDVIHGDSNDLSVDYGFEVSSITPNQAGLGGAEVIITGYGFEPTGQSVVTICGNDCNIISSSSSSITCQAPTVSGDDTCDVVVENTDATQATLSASFTYDSSMTTTVTSVSPKRGGTAGGTLITIQGSGFGDSGNIVTIDGSACVISAESSTEIECTTEDHAGPGEYPVRVKTPSGNIALTDENDEFYYVDLWSSEYTWGGNSPPTEGQLVVIENGHTILLDESTPVLKSIIIKGGKLMFDEDQAEIILRAEYILIVEGGALCIGSEENRYESIAIIELHGNTQSIELPHYGAKVLAVRDGSLDLHGKYIPVTWTHLATTASAGATTITLKEAVTWQAGDQIVIATTEKRFSKNENEQHTIASVSDDGLTLTLTEALEYEHISIEQTFAGRTIETRAEVGLLTRNVKIRGDINTDFQDVIEPCDETWNPGQFNTQSCFNGKFGEEIGSDQFGATVMIFGKFPNQDLVAGRIEYVEVTEAGQAFQLGRYPLHFHLVGNVSTSYIRGCAVHRTYNRAITIHAADYLTIERNVVYNNMGHAIFTEDGVEQFNVIQYNLAVYTRTSSSLLNVDITPSSYWVVNPNNIVRYNAAAGGTHFGYWYRLERHPSGPSATDDYCQNNEVMGEFHHNTAHSFGRYGLWVFSMDGYFPKDGNCGGNDLVARWNDFTVWHTDRGAEIVFGGNLQFHNFVALDNENAGLEMVKMKGGFGEDDGPGIFNSLLIGHSALSEGSCSGSGIIAPKQDIFSISDTTFVNYDTDACAALSGASQAKPFQGGFRAQTKGLAFENSPNKIKFKWQHETIWIDADGTLTGTAENTVVPSMDILPSSKCTPDVAEFSVNPEFPGSVCSDLSFERINVFGPTIEPDSLQGNELFFSNAHGNVSSPYMKKRLTGEGWMGIVYAGETYDMAFADGSQITNLSYSLTTRFVGTQDYFMLSHTLPQEPDGFGTLEGVDLNSTDAALDPNTNYHGDYHWDNNTRTLTYLVSGKEQPSGRTIFDDRELGEDRQIDFRVYRCLYENCIPPTPPVVPTGRPDAYFRWSDTETWKEVPVGSGGHPDENTYGLPVEGDEIIIPPGMWLLVDTATPKLGRVYVYGGLEFEDVMDHYFEATIIYIQGGTVVAGFTESSVFTNNLNIVLRGSLDPEDPDNEDMPMPMGVPNVGWKAMGVFGSLKLHGEDTGTSWTKLGATANAGDNTVTLAEAADPSWAGKEVMITTTSKETMETEIRSVVSVSGSTLTLDSPLAYDHLAESFTVNDASSTSFTMAGEVGLLTRNIVVEGNDYADLLTDSFGGRIIVSQLHHEGVDYIGEAKLSNVEFKNFGQEGFTDTDDPRYSLAFFNLPNDDVDTLSYVKKCSFNINFNTAIGVFDADNVTIADNVIYSCVGSCIKVDSNDVTIDGNLVSGMLAPATYNGRLEPQDFDWFAGIDLNKATSAIVTNNVVGGSEQAAIKFYGELCEDSTLWNNNEVHSAIYGVMMWLKSGDAGTLNECRRITNVYAWRIWDTAFYLQHHASLRLTNVASVDSKAGVNSIIYSPKSLSHQFVDKTATIDNSHFVGASPYHTCDYQDSEPLIYQRLYESVQPVLPDNIDDGGYSGIIFASFVSGTNMAPKHAFRDADSYPALYGSTIVRNVQLSNYGTRDCGTDVALITNAVADDAIHPIFTEGIAFADTDENNKVYFHEPNLGSVNPSDCVDMDCDGYKKIIITDNDGTLLGTAGDTLTAQAEFEWDGDDRRGVGDYRIPVSLKQKDDGSEITAVEKFPNKGIVRDGSCTLQRKWRGWKCSNMKHRMMIIESMDGDTEIRRLSPIALIANPGTNGYVDLLNGPMDRGWCFGYTCQERISTFYSVVAHGYTYEMAMTSTPPQHIRFHLLHSDDTEAVLLRMFFPKTQRYDIYVDGVYIPPTNIDTNSDKYQLLPVDANNPEAFFPEITDFVGTNYLQRAEKFLHVVLRGGHIIDIKTTPLVILSTGIVLDADDFFEENIVQHVANMLGVSTDNIVVTNIIREDSRRSRRSLRNLVSGLVTFDIASAVTTNVTSGEAATSGDVLSFDDLQAMSERFVNCLQTGCPDTNITITSGVIYPPIDPPVQAGPPATEEEGQVTIPGGELFSNIQQQQENEKLNTSSTAISYEQPGGSVVESGVPKVVKAFTPFLEQPCISVVTSDGEAVEALGYKSDPWMVEATLTGGDEDARLFGENPVPYSEGMACFTDLAVNKPGKGYSLDFQVVYPDEAPALANELGTTFKVAKKNVKLAVVEFPRAVNAKLPFNATLAVIDPDTGAPIDAAMMEGQEIKVMAKIHPKKKGKFAPPTTFTFNDVSVFTIEGLTVDKQGRSLKALFGAEVKPAGWKVAARSKNFHVIPKNIDLSEDAEVKTLALTLIGNGKALENKAEKAAFKFERSLQRRYNKVYWSDTIITVVKKKAYLEIKLRGGEDEVNNTLRKLCKDMKRKLKITYKKNSFVLKGLEVDGEVYTC